jgi:hypothetical protein
MVSTVCVRCWDPGPQVVEHGDHDENPETTQSTLVVASIACCVLESSMDFTDMTESHALVPTMSLFAIVNATPVVARAPISVRRLFARTVSLFANASNTRFNLYFAVSRLISTSVR